MAVRRSTIWSLFLILTAAVLVCPAAAKDESEGGGWLGVQIGQQALKTEDGSSIGSGVRYVVEDSPADKAGLRARDVILSVNGNPVSQDTELLRLLKQQEPGSWVELDIDRGGTQRVLRARLGDRPESMRGLRMRRGSIGVKAIDLPPALREHFGAPPEAGVMISNIVEGSPAEAAGFQLGDVVFEIDGSPIKSSKDLYGQVAGGGVGNKLEFKVVRWGAEMELEAVLEAIQ